MARLPRKPSHNGFMSVQDIRRLHSWRLPTDPWLVDGRTAPRRWPRQQRRKAQCGAIKLGNRKGEGPGRALASCRWDARARVERVRACGRLRHGVRRGILHARRCSVLASLFRCSACLASFGDAAPLRGTSRPCLSVQRRAARPGGGDAPRPRGRSHSGSPSTRSRSSEPCGSAPWQEP